MNKADHRAKKIRILDMLAGDTSLIGKDLDALTEAMALAVADYHTEAVEKACKRFIAGDVPEHNNAYSIKAPELAAEARKWDEAMFPKVVRLYNGLIEADYGFGRIDMRGLDEAEQNQIMRQKGLTADGQNFALLSIDAKRAALKQDSIAGPKTPTARIQRM